MFIEPLFAQKDSCYSRLAIIIISRVSSEACAFQFMAAHVIVNS